MQSSQQGRQIKVGVRLKSAIFDQYLALSQRGAKQGHKSKYSKVWGTYIARSYGLNSHEALQNGTC